MIYWKEANLEKYKVSTQYRRDHLYFPKIAAFDIETSRIDKTAFMYIWQFALDDLIVYGRTWEEFRNWLQVLREELRLAYDFKLAIYVHYLKYEFAFLHKLCIIDEKDFLARSTRDVIRCTIQGAFELRDSYIYTEKKLEVIGAELGIPKVSGYDYDKLRTSETELSAEELHYCETDVKILIEYFRRQLEFYGDSVAKLPITATQKVIRYMNSVLYEDTRKSKKIKYRIVNAQLDPKNERDMIVLQRLRLAFFGGWNFSNALHRNELIHNAETADISMSYGSQMLLHKFPKGRFKALPLPPTEPGKEIEAAKDMLAGKWSGYRGRALLIHFRADKIRALDPALAFLPVAERQYLERSPELRKRMKFSHVAACNNVEMCLTDIDFRMMLKWYDIQGLQLLDVLGSRYERLPEYVIKTIYGLSAEKQLRGQELDEIRKRGLVPTLAEQAEYNRVKSMISRIFGVFVQDPIRQRFAYSNEAGEVRPDGFINTFSEDRADRSLYRPVLYQWGVWVAAWGRWETLHMAHRIAHDPETGRFHGRLLYADTDSLTWYGLGDYPRRVIEAYNMHKREEIRQLCERYEFRPEFLQGVGEWRMEEYEQYKTTGQKQYAFIQNGHFDFHVAGLQREDWKEGEDGELHNFGMNHFDQFQTPEEKMAAFSEDLDINAEESHNLRAFYTDEPATLENVVDYQGHRTEKITVPSCMVLAPQEFRLRGAAERSRREALADKPKLETFIERNFDK